MPPKPNDAWKDNATPVEVRKHDRLAGKARDLRAKANGYAKEALKIRERATKRGKTQGKRA
jgi:hypothetical protein